MRLVKFLVFLVLVAFILVAVDFLGFYPVGKKTIGLLKKTPLAVPIEIWQLGSVRRQQWEGQLADWRTKNWSLKRKDKSLRP